MSLDAIAPPLDMAALLYFLLATGLYRLLTRLPPLERRSLNGAMQRQRLEWLLNMAKRENRMLDAVVLGNLGQGNAFFASTSAIAIGGLAATLGAGGERLAGVLAGLPYLTPPNQFVWAIKEGLIMAIFIYAFFKFAWAFRLSHFASIMVGATPNAAQSSPGALEQHARSTARLLGLAAEHANSGMRAFYHAIAAISWFLHPLLFVGATSWVVLILARRDFFSRSRRLVTRASQPATGSSV
jgi:uncharacterized membrane protein